MNLKEKQVLALSECLILWKYLSKYSTHQFARYAKAIAPGYNIKMRAIQNLFGQGKLSQKDYVYECPFCEHFHNSTDCFDCPWPVTKILSKLQARCAHSASPYTVWYKFPTDENAEKVFKLLQRIEL